MSRFIISLLIIFAVSLLQTSNIFIFGVKPNLVLIFLIVLSLINKSWIERLILVFLSIMILNSYPISIYNPAFDIVMISFAATIVLGMILIDYLPWAHLINLFIVVGAATVVLNIYNFDPHVVILESSYNMILTLILFALTQGFYVEQEIKRNQLR